MKKVLLHLSLAVVSFGSNTELASAEYLIVSDSGEHVRFVKQHF